MNTLMETNAHKRGFIPNIIKIKFGNSQDNIGSGTIDLPTLELHTTGTWLAFDQPSDWEQEQVSNAMIGTAYLIQSLVPLFIRCDRSDIHVVPQIKADHTEKPTLFIHDSYPGGIGLSEKIYERWNDLLQLADAHIKDCPCSQGCPSCIGPQDSDSVKQDVVALIEYLM